MKIYKGVYMLLLVAITLLNIVIYDLNKQNAYYKGRIDGLEHTVEYYRSLYFEEKQKNQAPPEIRVPNA